MPTSPTDVFLRLVHGVAAERWADLPDLYAERTDVSHPFHPARPPALTSRDALRAHFTPPQEALGFDREVADVRVHETTDPEVIVAEFEYRGTVHATGATFAYPCVFILRVRDGEIVESRDYIDPVAQARALGRVDDLLAALQDDVG